MKSLKHEINRRRRAEAELTAAKAHAQAVLDTAVDGIITIDGQGRVRSFNKAAERLFGYAAEQMLGVNVKRLMPLPYRADHDSYIQRYLATGEKKIIGIGREVTGLRKDGSTFPMELAVSEVLIEDQRYFTGLVRDISDRRCTQEQLRQREEQLRLTFDNAPLGIATSDLNNRLIDANPAYCAMLGYTREELLRLSSEQLIHPDDLGRHSAVSQEIWRGQRHTYILDLRYRCKDGATVYAILHTAMVHDANGRPLMAVMLVENRTAQRRAEDEARQHRERLAHVSRLSTLGEMATGIAHEINQPLTAIATYASACHRLIESDQGDSSELLATLDKIAAQAQRAGEVIRRLRGFIRKRESQRELCDLNALVEDSIALSMTDARAGDFTIFTRLASRPLMVEADSIQIQQVLLNLIRNAMEAMAGVAKAGEAVTVTVRTYAEDRRIAHVSVSDRGSGIDEPLTEKLFSPFFTTKADGLGMGLSISRSIIASHGGRLWFVPNPGGGVTMHFTVPLATDADLD